MIRSFGIAVLITYHNEGPLLTECLESLRGNTSPPDEILIYDDASSVPPEPFLPPGLPVRVITGAENHGPSYGRNILLSASICRYIHFHDADDLFAPHWCDEVRAALEANEPDVVLTEASSFRHGEPPSQTFLIGLNELARTRDLLRFSLSHGLLPACGTYSRERVLSIGGYSCDYWQSEDYDFHIRLAATGPRFSVVLRPLALQRIHPDNRSKDRVRVWADAVRILDKLAAELPAEYQQDVCDALARAGRTLYQTGAIAEARRAFRIARRIGRPGYKAEPAAYRIAARFCGPMMAERIGQVYRSLLPGSLRELARRPATNARP